jgi:hypothetical protein
MSKLSTAWTGWGQDQVLASCKAVEGLVSSWLSSSCWCCWHDALFRLLSWCYRWFAQKFKLIWIEMCRSTARKVRVSFMTSSIRFLVQSDVFLSFSTSCCAFLRQKFPIQCGYCRRFHRGAFIAGQPVVHLLSLLHGECSDNSPKVPPWRFYRSATSGSLPFLSCTENTVNTHRKRRWTVGFLTTNTDNSSTATCHFPQDSPLNLYAILSLSGDDLILLL